MKKLRAWPEEAVAPPYLTQRAAEEERDFYSRHRIHSHLDHLGGELHAIENQTVSRLGELGSETHPKTIKSVYCGHFLSTGTCNIFICKGTKTSCIMETVILHYGVDCDPSVWCRLWISCMI